MVAESMPTSQTATADLVPVREKLALGVGSLAAFYGYGMVSIMAYPVYNMLLGINAGLVGLALMFPRLWDAFAHPLMGKLSDNCRSPLGRRRPFVIGGAIAMGLIFALIWHVPRGWSQGSQVAYFIVLQLLYFTAYTVFSTPYTSLTYEMTPDYNERTRVMAYNAFFHKVGEFSGGWMIPLAGFFSLYFFHATTLEIGGVRVMGWIIGLFFMATLGVLPGIFVRERFARKTEHQAKVRILDSTRAALSSKPFLILLCIIIFNTLSGVLASGIDQYLLVYYMNDGNAAAGMLQKGLLTTGYAFVGFAAIPLITWMGLRLGKKGSLFAVYALMTLGGIMKWWIFTPGHPIWHANLGFGSFRLDPIILIDPLMCGPMWVAVKVMLASMMADVCDEDELMHGQRREGMFGAVFAWLEALVVSLSYFCTGLALNLSGFNVALGGRQTPETFTMMRLFLAGAPTLTAVFALIALKFYPLTAAHAAQTRRKLEERRGVVSANV